MLAPIYGDIRVAQAHGDAVWEERIDLPVDSTTQRFAAVRDEAMNAVFVPVGFGERALKAGAGIEAVRSVGQSIRALEKLVSERYPTGSACIQRALEGGKPLEDANRKYREDVRADAEGGRPSGAFDR